MAVTRRSYLIHVVRGLRLVGAGALAALLVVVGVSVWAVEPVLAICLVAGGQYMAMWGIADHLFPGASRGVTGFFKLSAALVFLTHLVAVAYVFGLA